MSTPNTQSLLYRLNTDPEVQKKFKAQPDPVKRAIVKSIFNTEVKQKYDKLNLKPEELEQVKQQFVSKYAGTKDPGPLPENFGNRSDVKEESVKAVPTRIPHNRYMTAAAGGLMRGAQNITGVAGIAPNPVSHFFGEAGASYEAGSEDFRKEHPWATWLSEAAGQTLSAEPLESLAIAMKAPLVVKSALAALPYSESWKGLTAGTFLGYGLGKVYNKFFGPKGVEVIEGAVKKVQAGAKMAETAADAERRAIYADLGVVDPKKTVAQLHTANPSLVPKVNDRLNELTAAKKAAAVTEAKAAKGSQAAEKAGLKAQERAGKATEAFVKRFGHDPSPEQLEGLKAGGAKLQGVMENEETIQQQLKQARRLLAGKRLQLIRKSTGKVPDESTITSVNDAIKSMSIQDINSELETYKKPPKPPTAPVESKPVATKPPTIQEQTATKLAAPVETPELAAARPDIVKAADQADALKQPEPEAKPRPAFTIKVGSKDIHVLTDEEARQPGAAKLAIDRIGAAAREFIAAEPDERKQTPVVNKSVALINYLKQEGVDEHLQKEGNAVFDNISKPKKSASGAKIGRPTKAEAAEKPPEQRAIETAEREAAALQEKRNVANYAKASGKEISVSEIAASGERKTSPTGGAGRLSSYDEFEKIYKRPAEPAESYMLESGMSPAESVDHQFQEAFEAGYIDSEKK